MGDCPAVAAGGAVYTKSGWTAYALRGSDGTIAVDTLAGLGRHLRGDGRADARLLLDRSGNQGAPPLRRRRRVELRRARELVHARAPRRAAVAPRHAVLAGARRRDGRAGRRRLHAAHARLRRRSGLHLRRLQRQRAGGADAAKRSTPPPARCAGSSAASAASTRRPRSPAARSTSPTCGAACTACGRTTAGCSGARRCPTTRTAAPTSSPARGCCSSAAGNSLTVYEPGGAAGLRLPARRPAALGRPDRRGGVAATTRQAFESDSGQLPPGVRFAASAPGHELHVTGRAARASSRRGGDAAHPAGRVHRPALRRAASSA